MRGLTSFTLQAEGLGSKPGYTQPEVKLYTNIKEVLRREVTGGSKLKS